MSKTVDERVVSMQFDNRQFEQNAKTSMSTIEKLKQSLKFKNSDEGLRNIESSVKRVDMKGLGSAVEAVSTKFSALQVMGVTALANITNSAVNAGKRMISALTFQPLKDGFNEYETQMNAVQTILANTQKEGTNVKIVNKYLDELNTYADKTIYNFTEMTRNIGTFTAAGVKLDTSVSAIKGIANLAAVSGSNSQQASTAMYQLSQAIASGTVKLMDWNSVVNAGMGGQVFQDALTRTSERLNTGAKAAIAAEGSFRESLSTGWLTTEVLTETLDQFATAAETQEEYEAAVKKFLDKGYTKQEAEEMAKMAKTAGEAATKVKTFTQLVDTLKEALGSGWTTTWRLIFGDFEEAREMWSSVSDVLGGFINNMSEARNKLLESALGKSFKDISDKISGVTKPALKAAESISKTVESVTNLDDIVSKVIKGDFGNGEDRINALTEAGENYYKIQNKVNETLGNSFRYTKEQIDAQDKLLGSKKETVETTKEEKEETSKLTKEKKELIKKIASMTEEQMREKGYTDEQIAAFKELGDTAKKLGIPLNEFIDNMDDINGRWLLLNSFKNIGKNIVKIFTSIGEAWKEVFPPITSDNIFNVIAGFHKLTATLLISDENADKLKRTFKGLFAVLDLVTSIVGGGFKLAFKTVSYILSYFDLNILDVTAAIGDALVSFRDWVKENNLLVKALDAVLPYLEDFAIGIRDWIEGIKEADNIPKYIIEGLVNGLRTGVNTVVSAVIELGRSILDAIKNILGIHSPSKEFFDIGKNIIQGLIDGLKSGLSSVYDFMSNIGSKLIGLLKKIDFGTVFAVGMGAGSLYVINKLANTLKVLTGPIEGITNVLDSVSGVLDAISAKIKAKILLQKSKAILNMAIAIGILAASIYVLAQLDTGRLWATIGAIAALSAIMLALSFAAGKMGAIGDFGAPSTAIIAVAGSLLILSFAMKKLSTIKGEDVPKIIAMITTMVVGLSAILIVFGKFCNVEAAGSIDKAGIMLLKISAALYIMTKVVKMAGKLDSETMTKGLIFIGVLELFVAGLVAVSKLSGEHASKAGSMLLKISIAMGIMVGVVKLAGQLDPEEIGKGLLFIGALELFVISLVAVSKLSGEHASKAGSMLLKISVALLIMVKVVELAGKLEEEPLKKGLKVIAILETFMIALVAVSKLAGKNAAKAGFMLLEVAASLFILTGVLYLLGKMDSGDTAKALAIVSVLEILFGGLIAVSSLAQNCKGTLITLTVSITLLISAITALTLIDQDKLRSSTVSISMVIGAFAALIAATGTLKNAKQAVKTLLPLTAVVIGIAALLSAMALLNVEPSIQTAKSIGILLNSMASAMLILSNAKHISTKSIGQLAIMGLVVAELGLILKGLDLLNIDISMSTVASLSLLLLSMSGSLLIVSAVGTMCPGAMAGITSLMAFIGAIGLMMVGIGELNALTQGDLANFVSQSIPILQDFGEGIGNFVGGLVGGAIAGLVDGLLGIGTSLSKFIDELKPFIESASQIDPGSMEGIKSLADAILILTASNVLDGLSSFLGGRDMTELGAQMVAFGNSLVLFSDTIKGKIDNTSVEAAANAGTLMAEMQNKIVPSGGVVQWFCGEKDMRTFGQQMVAFGSSIVLFSDTVKGKIDISAVEAAANAGSIMSEFQSNLTATGGVVQWFCGEKDMSTFGTQLVSFGESIVSFSKTVSADGTINETAIEAAKRAGLIMVELQDAINPIGGVVGFFCGDNNLKKFGNQIKSFGESIVSFSNTIEEGGITSASAEAAKSAGMIMVELQKAIPEKNFFDGKVTLKKFGKQVKSFGKSIADYAEKVSGINTTAVTTSVEAGKGIAETAKLLQTFDGDKIKKFDLSGMGDSLKTFYNSIEGIDSVTLSSATLSIGKLVNTIKNMSGMDISGVTTFKTAVKNLSSVNLNDVSKSFNNNSSKMSGIGKTIINAIRSGITSNQGSLNNTVSSMINKVVNSAKSRAITFTIVGRTLMANFIKGITDQSPRAAASIGSMLARVVISAKSYYTKFYNAGSYVVSGFAKGISDNTYKAEVKARAMAKKAYNAAKNELDINSPSKVFRGLAYSIPEGFAQGIDRRSDMVVKSSKDMAKDAVEATKSTLSNISNMVFSDMDSQPTIRPVMDLSEVNSGVNAINGMFGMKHSVGAIANINSISSMMNNRQNGTNEVASAIDKLNRRLDNVKGDSYTINGITYDDGTNISNAVQSLIRAARVERRI